jgi:hypothetical protein
MMPGVDGYGLIKAPAHTHDAMHFPDRENCEADIRAGMNMGGGDHHSKPADKTVKRHLSNVFDKPGLKAATVQVLDVLSGRKAGAWGCLRAKTGAGIAPRKGMRG